MKPTIIKVRRGINGHRYCACKENGCFIGNFDKLSDVRKHWALEIRRGQVILIRELDKQPDMSAIEGARQAIHNLLLKLCDSQTKISES